MPDELIENLIIGGGPAGAGAAILLARSGRSVTLLEKSRTAHDKVCGEFISWEAAAYLERLGLDLPALGACHIGHLRLIDGDRIAETRLPFPAWSLSRRILDETLLLQAARAGVSVQRGIDVRALRKHHGHWQITTQDEIGRLAKNIFLASGKHDLRDRGRAAQGPPPLIGFKMHFRLSAPQQELLRQCVEMYPFDGGYAGLEPIEHGKANLCFLVHKEIYATCGKNWSGVLRWLSALSAHLEGRLAGAEALWERPLAIYNIPYGFIYRGDSTENDIYHLGDQMAVIPSFAGDGIAMALHSAFLAADNAMAGRTADQYHAVARHDFAGPIRNAGIAARSMAGGQRRRLCFNVLTLFPRLFAPAIRATRLAKKTIIATP